MSTAASPAERGPFGGTILQDAVLSGPASHDGSGRRFVFRPARPDGHRYALDVERRDLPPPEQLAALLGEDAMAAWGEIEVMAKLLDIPAHLLLRRVLAGERDGLVRSHRIEFRRADTPGLWRVVARCPL